MQHGSPLSLSRDAVKVSYPEADALNLLSHTLLLSQSGKNNVFYLNCTQLETSFLQSTCLLGVRFVSCSRLLVCAACLVTPDAASLFPYEQYSVLNLGHGVIEATVIKSMLHIFGKAKCMSAAQEVLLCVYRAQNET